MRADSSHSDRVFLSKNSDAFGSHCNRLVGKRYLGYAVQRRFQSSTAFKYLFPEIIGNIAP